MLRVFTRRALEEAWRVQNGSMAVRDDG